MSSSGRFLVGNRICFSSCNSSGDTKGRDETHKSNPSLTSFFPQNHQHNPCQETRWMQRIWRWYGMTKCPPLTSSQTLGVGGTKTAWTNTFSRNCRHAQRALPVRDTVGMGWPGGGLSHSPRPVPRPHAWPFPSQHCPWCTMKWARFSLTLGLLCSFTLLKWRPKERLCARAEFTDTHILDIDIKTFENPIDSFWNDHKVPITW
jgi:hypothetical protein